MDIYEWVYGTICLQVQFLLQEIWGIPGGYRGINPSPLFSRVHADGGIRLSVWQVSPANRRPVYSFRDVWLGNLENRCPINWLTYIKNYWHEES